MWEERLMERSQTDGIFVRRLAGALGSGPTLLILHGASADGEVWQDLLPALAKASRRLLIPDLPGHGRSLPLPLYGLGNIAARLASLFEQDEHVSVLGHSLGGALGITLASNLYGIIVDCVLAIDVKLNWTAEEVSKGRELALRPARTFDTEDDAVERYLKVSGLHGIVDPNSSMARSGVKAVSGGYGLRTDPGTNRIAGTTVRRVARSIDVPLHLLVGNRNPMMSEREMRELDPGGRLLESCGHNAHVERPDLVGAWAFEQLSRAGPSQ
jgi:pimeloyl-ACP methyl ester carboxylesterase